MAVLLHRFPHRLQASEVNHPRHWGSRCKGAVQIRRVADVALQHLQPFLLCRCLQIGQLGHPPQGFRAAVGEVVEHHQPVPRLQQHQSGVAADVHTVGRRP